MREPKPTLYKEVIDALAVLDEASSMHDIIRFLRNAISAETLLKKEVLWATLSALKFGLNTGEVIKDADSKYRLKRRRNGAKPMNASKMSYVCFKCKKVVSPKKKRQAKKKGKGKGKGERKGKAAKRARKSRSRN